MTTQTQDRAAQASLRARTVKVSVRIEDDFTIVTSPSGASKRALTELVRRHEPQVLKPFETRSIKGMERTVTVGQMSDFAWWAI